ncbi:MAG: hypothetical protein IKF36_04880 [Bacilli bacterium]|nr:hypothetical protein [Bacilli bacterium]
MAYFSKEKDLLLRIVNSVLIVGLVITIIITLATGIKIINKEKVGTYEEYAKNVCTIDKLEYECTDEACIQELDKERKKTCTSYYLEEKKEKEKINKANKSNFFISLGASLILFCTLKLLNRKQK